MFFYSNKIYFKFNNINEFNKIYDINNNIKLIWPRESGPDAGPINLGSRCWTQENWVWTRTHYLWVQTPEPWVRQGCKTQVIWVCAAATPTQPGVGTPFQPQFS